jgi:hypothetical protein
LSATGIDNRLIIKNMTTNNGILRIYDIQGKEIAIKQYAANNISVIEMPYTPGVYVCNLTNADGKSMITKVVLK